MIEVTPASAADYADLLALNDAAVPAVNLIDEGALAHLHGQAAACLVARASPAARSAAAPRPEDPAGPPGPGCAGFLLALDQNANYDSPNYTYFRSRYDRFVYVDRIVVSAAFRRRGVGALLYGALFRQVPAGTPVTCEVNLRPPNPGSLSFHETLGFLVVGEQDTEGGAKRVALMRRPADSAR